jgi:hypothetical protein
MEETIAHFTEHYKNNEQKGTLNLVEPILKAALDHYLI